MVLPVFDGREACRVGPDPAAGMIGKFESRFKLIGGGCAPAIDMRTWWHAMQCMAQR
jgi:hypothetical protein